MRVVIASAEKMDVIRRYQAKPQISRNLNQRGIAQLLFFHPVVVQFHEEILRAKDIPIFRGALRCFLDVICLNRVVDFACKTAA